jgi:hypothetical protein
MSNSGVLLSYSAFYWTFRMELRSSLLEKITWILVSFKSTMWMFWFLKTFCITVWSLYFYINVSNLLLYFSIIENISLLWNLISLSFRNSWETTKRSINKFNLSIYPNSIKPVQGSNFQYTSLRSFASESRSSIWEMKFIILALQLNCLVSWRIIISWRTLS